MEDFIRALGAEPVVYPYRNECCGGYVSLKDKAPGRYDGRPSHGIRGRSRSGRTDYRLSSVPL